MLLPAPPSPERQDIFQLDKPSAPWELTQILTWWRSGCCSTALHHMKSWSATFFFFMVPWILFSFLKPVFSSLLHFFLHYIVASSPFSPWSISPKFSHCCYLSIPASYQSAPPSLQTDPQSFPFKSTCWLSFLGADATISLMTDRSLLAFLWGLRRVSSPCWTTPMTKTSTTWADVY